jgi:hypothetical protein
MWLVSKELKEQPLGESENYKNSGVVMELKGLRIEPARKEAWRLHLAVAAVLARLGSLWSQRDGYFRC